jgi:hypothetical protein
MSVSAQNPVHHHGCDSKVLCCSSVGSQSEGDGSILQTTQSTYTDLCVVEAAGQTESGVRSDLAAEEARLSRMAQALMVLEVLTILPPTVRTYARSARITVYGYAPPIHAGGAL